MTTNSQIDHDYFHAPEEYWSEACISFNENRSVQLQIPDNGTVNSWFYLIPVGNAKHPDLRINSCMYMAIATRYENGTLMYLQCQADCESKTGKAIVTSTLDRNCVFIKYQNLLDEKVPSTIQFINDENVAMYLHYREFSKALIFKECDAASGTEMFWVPKFKKAIHGAPPREKSRGRIVAEEIVKEIGTEILVEVGLSLLVGFLEIL